MMELWSAVPMDLTPPFRIWVNPTPEIRVSALDTVICDGENFIINVGNPNTPVRGNWKYDLQVTADPEINGPDLNATGITTASFDITLENGDTVVHRVAYRFIPRITPDDNGVDCGNGRDTTIVIWVNPTPEIRVNADTVICDGGTATIQVTNPNNPIRGTWLYDLDVTADPEIDGEALDQTGITTALFNETLSNTDSVVHKVIYHFTPRIISRRWWCRMWGGSGYNDYYLGKSKSKDCCFSARFCPLR